MIITSTGYYNTGSSAVCDLLKEYEECSEGVFKGQDYEHLILYTPNGLFDLEDKLLIGNNIHRSDEAVDMFREEMFKLYNHNFLWFGNFKKFLGDNFVQDINAFVDEIVDFDVKTNWYYDYLETKYSPVKLIKDIIKTILHLKINGDFSKKLVMRSKQKMSYSFVDPDRFYRAARKFVQGYFTNSTTEPNKKLILDHFLLPHNLFRIPNYFDDDLRVFVVERDPRDVYIQQMNRRHLRSESIPMQIDDFIAFWRKVREIECPIEDKRICRIHFEELVYQYEETVKKIEDFCGLDSKKHIEPRKYFDPAKSIKTTKLYVGNTEYQEEIKKIERELPEFLFV